MRKTISVALCILLAFATLAISATAQVQHLPDVRDEMTRADYWAALADK